MISRLFFLLFRQFNTLVNFRFKTRGFTAEFTRTTWPALSGPNKKIWNIELGNSQLAKRSEQFQRLWCTFPRKLALWSQVGSIVLPRYPFQGVCRSWRYNNCAWKGEQKRCNDLKCDSRWKDLLWLKSGRKTRRMSCTPWSYTRSPSNYKNIVMEKRRIRRQSQPQPMPERTRQLAKEWSKRVLATRKDYKAGRFLKLQRSIVNCWNHWFNFKCSFSYAVRF